MAIHELLAASRVIRDRIHRKERVVDPSHPSGDGGDEDARHDVAVRPRGRGLFDTAASREESKAVHLGATRTSGEGGTIVETQGGDVRQRAAALMQEAGDLLGMIPQLLERTEELKTSAEGVGKETDTLRKELAALRSEVQQMRAERDEMADSLTALMNEISKLANEAISKLRHPERRSAFWREGAAPVAENASSRPVPHVPWKRTAD